jgi:ABC-type glycerol-3-phosphate transport system substrate-binding protein
MKRIKQLTAILLVLGAAFVLAMPQKRGEPIPTDRVVIRYWEKWTGREADQMKEIVDAFNDTVGREKGIYCQYISMSAVDQKTLVATAAGVPPDVAGVWGDQLAQFAAMNALTPLEEMAKEHGITREYYKPVFWESCSYGGHLYAMVATPFTVGLYWNKQIFAQEADKLRAAGLDPTRPPKTIDELDQYAKVLEKYDEKGNLIRAGFFDQQPGWWMEHVYRWFGGSIYDEATGKLTLTDPKVVKAYEWLRSYTVRIGRDQVVRFSSGLPNVDTFDTPLNPFMTGDVAMMKQGPWFPNYFEKLRPEMNRWKMSKEEEKKLPFQERKQNYTWGAAPFPSSEPGLENSAYAGVDILVIPSTSKHKKEAFEFIAFVNRQDNMEKLVSMHCKVSPLAKLSEHYLENHDNPYADVFEMLAASPNCKGIPPVPIWPQIRDELRKVAGEMVLNSNNRPAEVALAEAQVKLQAQLDQFNQRLEKRAELGLTGN